MKKTLALLAFLLSIASISNANATTIDDFMTGLKAKIATNKSLIAREEKSSDPEKKTMVIGLKQFLSRDEAAYAALHKTMLSWKHDGCKKDCRNKRIRQFNAVLLKTVKAHPVSFPLVGNISGLTTVKNVFIVDRADPGLLQEQLVRAHNILVYAKQHNLKAHIAFVAEAAGVVMFTKKALDNTHTRSVVREMAQDGVKFYACRNAMLNNMLIPALMPSVMHFVPVGILQADKLVNEHYVLVNG